MSHSKELIDLILGKVQESYPASQHTFSIEKAIPGTRFYPDIFVSDVSGNPVCAVEIGYTRPEKLTAYRKALNIPDVRWYDKAGNLHTDIQQKSVDVAIRPTPIGNFAVYRIFDMVECRDENCEMMAMVEHELTDEDLRNPNGLADEVYEKAADVSTSLCLDVTTVIVTDYFRVWFVCYCDKCGDTWAGTTNTSMDLEGIANDLEDLTATEFAHQWAPRKFYGDWDGAVKWVDGYLGFPLEYANGEFLSKKVEKQFNQSMAAIRFREMRAATKTLG